MQNHNTKLSPVPQLAIRLIGFSSQEESMLEATLAVHTGGKYIFCCLEPDSLQDPDLYFANADDLKALAILSSLGPSDIRPALLIGAPAIALPYPHLARPIRWRRLLDALDVLVEKRASALARLHPAALLAVSERRQRYRVDIDLTDPIDYIRMRKSRRRDGGVLIIDRNALFRDFTAELMTSHQVPVAWVATEQAALDYCNQHHVAVVLINAATPGVEPYRLCRTIKNGRDGDGAAVILLSGKPFLYDSQQAQAAGCSGFLDKPVSAQLVLATLQKYLR
ncbi:response regulator [Herminiimonas sp. CN]|uniref:response regulator n=1 Tax=Herminiimonas sp. CN TaxID=1349818 RepID=UPI0004737783|nr:response regulator [Herminiimonas sp. CN]